MVGHGEKFGEGSVSGQGQAVQEYIAPTGLRFDAQQHAPVVLRVLEDPDHQWKGLGSHRSSHDAAVLRYKTRFCEAVRRESYMASEKTGVMTVTLTRSKIDTEGLALVYPAHLRTNSLPSARLTPHHLPTLFR